MHLRCKTIHLEDIPCVDIILNKIGSCTKVIQKLTKPVILKFTLLNSKHIHSHFKSESKRFR